MAEIGGWGLDVSNHSGAFGVATAQRMVAEGWNRLIASTYDRDICRAQLQAAQAAGMEIQAYTYMRAERDPVLQVQEAFLRLAGIPITRMWFDFEGAPTDPIPNDWTLHGGTAGVVSFIQRTVDAPRDIAAGIYTARGWWERWTGNDTRLAPFYPLWNATNDQLGDLSFVPYGGWIEQEMEQFAFDIQVAGVNTDWNAIAKVVPPAPPPVDPLAEYKRGRRDQAQDDRLAAHAAVDAAIDSTLEPWS